MKSFFFSLGFLVIFFFGNLSSLNNNLAEEALLSVQANFHNNLKEITRDIQIYTQKAEALREDPGSIQNLQAAHLATRMSFKKAELFLEYFDREGVKKHINGAPLPKVEPHVPEIRIIDPSGLQTLDELVFSEEVYAEKEAILKLVYKLQNKFNQMQAYQTGIQMQHRYIFEAARQELVRIFTLGVSGFDTPGSVNAIPEAVEAVKGIEAALSFYYPLIKKEAPALQEIVVQLLSESTAYLSKHQDFNTFDRLAFLRKYINPLYSVLYDIHIQLNIETIEETTSFIQPTNYKARNIFSDDFLNPNYYAHIIPKNLTKERIALGKLLFFDPILSGNNERSCASCHNPKKGFTDGLDKSLAFNKKGKILRNAPTIVNSVFAERYFHDLREPDIERQITHVIKDTLEFNTDFLQIIEKISKSKTYQELFAAAYSDQPKYQLSKWSISNALASYVTSLKSFNSPFDQYVRGETNTIDPKVANGFNLFMGKAACGTCHFAPSFSGIVPPIYEESESEVLGVPKTKDEDNPVIDPDPGRIASSRPQDEAPFYAFSFKTPTVRNIELTAPYMHNGVYHTLEEVVDFYNKGGGIGLGLDVPYQTLPDAPLDLTDTEVDDLIVFMHALTDTTGMTAAPQQLPKFDNNPEWNKRVPGGLY